MDDAPEVHCRVCRLLLMYDPKRGLFVHAEDSRRVHIAEPNPKELRAYRAWRKGERT